MCPRKMRPCMREENLILRHTVFMLDCLGENEKRVGSLCELLSLQSKVASSPMPPSMPMTFSANFLSPFSRVSDQDLAERCLCPFTGKSAGCPAFLLQGRGGKPTL